MAEQELEALVLKDTEGNYYVFDRDAFERARVTDDALRSQLDEEVDDSQGFALAPLFNAPISHKLPGIINGGLRPIPPHQLPQTQLGSQGLGRNL